jgi:hypothetical protein
MTSAHNHENELRRREKELEQRELEMRLRELESELTDQVPLHRTVKHQPKGSKFQRWQKQAPKIMLFGGTILGSLVVLNVAQRIAGVLFGVMIMGTIAFVAYKLFVEGENAKS